MTINVIAKFAKFETCFYAVLILAVFIWLFASTYIDMSNHPPGTSALEYEWSKLRWRPITLIGIAFGLLGIWAQLQLLWQLIVRRGRAVWIADGQLCFFNNYAYVVFQRVPMQDIDHLSTIPAQPLRSSAVVLHLKNGERKYIPAQLLTETAAAFMPRLSAALT